MWKCSSCGTENEWNFCTNCRCKKEDSQAMESTSKEAVVDFTEAKEPEEKSGRKGCLIAIIVVVVIVGLLSALVFTAINMLIITGDSQESLDVVVEEDSYDVYIEVDVLNGESPFNLDVWGLENVVQIESGGIVLQVPISPDIIKDDVVVDNDTLWLSQGDSEGWIGVNVLLRNIMEDDFRVYSDYEVERTFWWHYERGEVVDIYDYIEEYATLVVTDWKDDFGRGTTFTKISQYQGFILVTEISFETIENREDFFEAYGFNKLFGGTIREIFAYRALREVDLQESELDLDVEGVEWTSEDHESWWARLDVFNDAYGRSFDMYFFVWDYVIINETILDMYPNADVERLEELHIEFGDRFEELNALLLADTSLAYSSEYNQNIFQEMEDLAQLHDWFYYNFRAALEGRPPVD